MMTEAEQFTERINKDITCVKAGSLRFWGHWFGRPYDNNHKLVGCDVENDVLRLHFNEDELLSVWSPRGIEANKSTFRILEAARVRWEWFYYGRPKIDANLYFEDFTKLHGKIDAITNVNWFTPHFETNPLDPAVEILSFEDMRRSRQ